MVSRLWKEYVAAHRKARHQSQHDSDRPTLIWERVEMYLPHQPCRNIPCKLLQQGIGLSSLLFRRAANIADIKFVLLTFSTLYCISDYVESANILYAIPFTSMSHYISLSPIGKELARRGHNVTVITPYKEKEALPNYHEVIVDDKKIWELLGGEKPNVFTTTDQSSEEFHHNVLWAGGLAFTELSLNSVEVKTFLKQDNKFDLVVVEQFLEEAFYALAEKYNAPLVLVTTFGNCMKHNLVTRNPLQLSTVIYEVLELQDPTSYWGRFKNLYFTVFEYVWWRFSYLKKQEELVKKYLPEVREDLSLYEMQKNAALMLINGHFSFDVPAAYLPNIIEVGGFHLSKSNNTLPTDLQKLLDESVHGVVYMSFGSNVRSAELPLEKKNAFLKVFKRLKQTVLWKWEDDKLVGKPNNLVTRKWLPQKDILAHPNVKVFISHGGLIGTQEAVFNGVPLLGVPIYGDQYNNLLLAEQAGFGKILRYHDINEQNLDKTLNKILNDESYMNNAKEMSRRFKDRPMSALDTAMFWIEYVIRNEGAEFMKNPARNLSWIAYNMLDVYATIAVIVFTFLFIIVKFLLILKSLMFQAQEKVDKRKKRS